LPAWPELLRFVGYFQLANDFLAPDLAGIFRNSPQQLRGKKPNLHCQQERDVGDFSDTLSYSRV